MGPGRPVLQDITQPHTRPALRRLHVGAAACKNRLAGDDREIVGRDPGAVRSAPCNDIIEGSTCMEGQEQKRPDQEVWDCLTEHFGPVRTEQERGRRNRAIRELLGAGATTEEIGIAVEFCRRNFTTYTEMALCGWLSRALLEHEQKGGQRETFLKLLSGGEGR